MTGSTYALEPRLDISNVGALHAALLAHEGQDLTLDAENVTHFGALAVQTIRAAARSWAQSGHALTLQKVSVKAQDHLYLLGFTPDTLTQWEHET